MIKAYPYTPSLVFEPTLGGPWLCYVVCPNAKRDDMRMHGRAAFRQVLRCDVSETKYGPTALNVQLSVSYAENLCLLGVSSSGSNFGIDLVHLAVFDDWSTDELSDVAAVYLTQKPANFIDFAHQWALFEAGNKALKRGIQEHCTVQPYQTWGITGLPAGFIGAAAVV